MTRKSSLETPRRGRPRSEEARNAILGAAIELAFEHGVQAMSMDEVAARAGVSKATIYRWWPSKELLVLDALQNEIDSTIPTIATETGTLRGDLIARSRLWMETMQSRPFTRVFASLLAHQHTDAAFAKEYFDRFVEPRRVAAREPLRRAIASGELPPDTDVELAIEFLYAPLWQRLLYLPGSIDDAFIEKVIDTAIAGLKAASQTRRRPSTKPNKA